MLGTCRKNLDKLLLPICIIGLNAIAAEPKIHINDEFYLQYNNITGPGKAQSSLTDGLRYYNMFNLYLRGKQNDFRYNLNVGIKVTDDRKKDIKDVSLTNFQGVITNKIHTVRIGDVFESFSQYSLNTALKGASYRYLSKDKINQLQFVYGIAYPRWDTFWDNDTKAVKRKVAGTRYMRNLLDGKMKLGASFVYSDDKDRVFATTPLYKIIYTQ